MFKAAVVSRSIGPAGTLGASMPRTSTSAGRCAASVPSGGGPGACAHACTMSQPQLHYKHCCDKQTGAAAERTACSALKREVERPNFTAQNPGGQTQQPHMSWGTPFAPDMGGRFCFLVCVKHGSVKLTGGHDGSCTPALPPALVRPDCTDSSVGSWTVPECVFGSPWGTGGGGAMSPEPDGTPANTKSR